MDDQQNLVSKSLKDRAWTTDEIRKHSSNWTLAGDVGLFNLLNEFSHQIISRTHEVENAVDSLVHQTKMTSAKINNVINDFHMLSNLQFVENRVYDEEVQEPVSENKPPAEKTKEQREAEMLPKIMQAIELGLAVLDTAFDRINVNEISDSEDEEDISSEGRTILEPKDPYANRPLPYIIGSEEFMKCDYAGLKDLIEDDALSFSEESSISETDETSSDEGEALPLDDDKFSEKQNDEISQNNSRELSSSDESELFGSEKEVNGFGSDTSFEFKAKEKNIQRTAVDVLPEKEERQNSISSLQSKLKLPQVLPVPKLQEKEKDDDLFAKEDNSDDESPFRKKTSLFASDVRFGDEKDDDLFGGDLFGKSPAENIKEVKTEVPKASIKKLPSSAVPETRKATLFDNDEDSEDDIFNTLMKTKKPSATKTSNAGSQDSSEKADTSSTPSSAPSTKPSGNAFDFVTGGGNNDSLFGDDSDGDDLFSSKKTQGKKFEFDSSENDDLFGIISSKVSKESKVLDETKSSLFEDSKEFELPKKRETEKPILTKKKTKDSIFEDSDSSDQEKQVSVKSPLSFPVKSKKEISLFGDDDLDGDIFSQVNQKKPEVKKETKKLSLFDEESKPVKTTEIKPVKAIEKSKPLSLFDDAEESMTKETKSAKVVEKSKTLSLFDDDAEEEPPKSFSNVPKMQQNKSTLFDDSDNFDLFAPKPPLKQVESSVPVHAPKPDLEVSKAKDEIDGIASSKVSSSVTDIRNADNQASFDTPVDSHNVLNVINKGRVRVAAKRRKPTRQGRLAALENSEKQAKAIVETVPANSNLGVLEDSDDVFPASVTKTAVKSEPPKLDYKAQEKKKMNIMSQLMSEVTTSKIVQKRVVEDDDDDDDDVDIFSEAAKRDRSKSSFSFRPPEENGIASMFPIEKKEEKTDDNNVSKSDSFEDDFFTEPAFQNFRSSISHKDPPVLDLEDDDDDDLFSAIKSNVLPKAKPEPSDSNDLFGDDTDIFADVQKEKYEMFPNQIYDDEDDDIFSNVNNTCSSKSSSNALSKTTNSTVKKVETQQVNAFDDPLTGLLGEE